MPDIDYIVLVTVTLSRDE